MDSAKLIANEFTIQIQICRSGHLSQIHSISQQVIKSTSDGKA